MYKASNGVYLTQGLFYEFNNIDAPFTLRAEDYTSQKGNKYKSMFQAYLECTDEYEAAIELLGSYDHWKKLCKLSWFMDGYELSTGFKYPGLRDWREEMRLRDASISKALLTEQAKEGNLTAMKYLHEISTKGKSAGRPAKPEKAIKSTDVSKLYNNIMERKK